MKYLSLFSGIGGFELGIQQAYEELCNANRSENAGSEKDKKGNKGQRLQSAHRKEISTKKGSVSECDNDIINKRPLCIGYSEFDPSCDKAKCKGYHTAINGTQSKCGTCGKIKTQSAIQIYNKHFNHKNYGDITKIESSSLPDFDLLVGGFPCQSFSIAGKRKGFEDTRGTLFFEIARIVKEKQPRLLLLENVKGLLSHDKGATFFRIISTLDELGYDCQWQVLNSKNFGVPQNRERVFIIGHLRGTSRPQVFPIREGNSKTLKQIIGGGQGNRVYSTDGVSVTQASQAGGQGAKTGLYAIPQTRDCCVYYLDANYSKGQNNPKKCNRSNITDGIKIRRLTPKECERLQGFPDDWTKWGFDKEKKVCGCLPEKSSDYCPCGDTSMSDTARYKAIGNAVTTNVIKEIMKRILL